MRNKCRTTYLEHRLGCPQVGQLGRHVGLLILDLFNHLGELELDELGVLSVAVEALDNGQSLISTSHLND